MIIRWIVRVCHNDSVSNSNPWYRSLLHAIPVSDPLTLTAVIIHHSETALRIELMTKGKLEYRPQPMMTEVSHQKDASFVSIELHNQQNSRTRNSLR